MELVGGLANLRAKRGIASSKKYQPDELSVGAREQIHLARAGSCSKGWAMNEKPSGRFKPLHFQGFTKDCTSGPKWGCPAFRLTSRLWTRGSDVS
jgi:hypothetical protein